MVNRLDEIKKRHSEATPGLWLEREDLDYYQGGTYLGVGPQKFVPNPNLLGTYHRVPCAVGEHEYFHTDICRIESFRDKEFIKHAHSDIAFLLTEIERLQKGGTP